MCVGEGGSVFPGREERRHDGCGAGGGRGRGGGGGGGGAAGPARGEASVGRPRRSGEALPGRGGGGLVSHLETNKMDYPFEITTVLVAIGLTHSDTLHCVTCPI